MTGDGGDASLLTTAALNVILSLLFVLSLLFNIKSETLMVHQKYGFSKVLSISY